jgi:putative NADH-flavin reductase
VEDPRRLRTRTDINGNSEISRAGHAVAFVDEIEQPRHHRTRFTMGY